MILISKILRFFKMNKKPISVDYIEVGGTKIYPEDIQLIKLIRREVMEKGHPVVVHPPTIAQKINMMSYDNAKERKKVEGWDAHKTLIETGYYVPD
jgi:hypothetical protein